jgi:DNA-binding transcriptional regulator YiaG
MKKPRMSNVDLRRQFAERLTRYMREQHMTPPMMACRIHVDPTTVYNWIAGRKLPDPINLNRLCRVLQKRHGSLLFG